MKITKSFLNFIALNLLIVLFSIYALLSGMNGSGNEFPTIPFAVASCIALLIIVIQYPILMYRDSWLYKIFIFYLSMVVFLFAFGVVLSWNQKVGGNPAGSWYARLDGAIRMTFMGHLMGWLFLILIILVNWFAFGKTLLKNRK